MAIYSEFSQKKMVIFHSHVSLPEGTIWFAMENNPFSSLIYLLKIVIVL